MLLKLLNLLPEPSVALPELLHHLKTNPFLFPLHAKLYHGLAVFHLIVQPSNKPAHRIQIPVQHVSPFRRRVQLLADFPQKPAASRKRQTREFRLQAPEREAEKCGAHQQRQESVRRESDGYGGGYTASRRGAKPGGFFETLDELHLSEHSLPHRSQAVQNRRVSLADEVEILAVEIGERIGLEEEGVSEVGDDGVELFRRRNVVVAEGEMEIEAAAGLDTVDGFEKAAADGGSFGADIEVVEKEGFEFW